MGRSHRVQAAQHQEAERRHKRERERTCGDPPEPKGAHRGDRRRSARFFIITNSWQGKHVIRNEPGMPRRQFLDGLHTILNSPDKAARQDASQAMFNCNTTAFDAAPASIQHMTVGDQGDPIVPNRNVNRSIEGIRQDRHLGAAVRNRDFDFRGGNYSTGDQVDATGDDVPDDTKGREATAHGDTEDGDDGNEQVQAMVREMMHKAGFPDDAYDMSMLSEATAASHAAGLPQEDEEPFELCDYCRNRGFAACMKCLLRRGNSGKKVVRTGQLAFFSD
ncbi:unnamed protein product [Ectocarpus sp. 13 AM-2016]